MTNILAQIIVTLATNVYDIPNTTPPIRVAWIERRQEIVFQIQGGEFDGRAFKEFLRADYIREAWLEAKPVAPLLSNAQTLTDGQKAFMENQMRLNAMMAAPIPELKPELPPLAETSKDNFEPIDGTKPIVPRALELDPKP